MVDQRLRSCGSEFSMCIIHINIIYTYPHAENPTIQTQDSWLSHLLLLWTNIYIYIYIYIIFYFFFFFFVFFNSILYIALDTDQLIYEPKNTVQKSTIQYFLIQYYRSHCTRISECMKQRIQCKNVQYNAV